MWPTCCPDLMVKASSQNIDYHRDGFDIDLNGKRIAWQGVTLLPFNDERRAYAELEGLDEKLTDSERLRNSFGPSFANVHQLTSLGKSISSLAREFGWDAASAAPDQGIPDGLADGLLFGRVSIQPKEGGGNGPVVPDGISGRTTAAMRFELPLRRPHRTHLLKGGQVSGRMISATVLADVGPGTEPGTGAAGRATAASAEHRTGLGSGTRPDAGPNCTSM